MIGSAARVLVVDDLPANLLAMRAVLEPLGHALATASSGEEALKLLLVEEFAVILLDVNMPGMDGFETARFLRALERTRSLPIVFVTARDENEGDLKQALTYGLTDFVYKPVSPEALRGKVSVYLDLYEKTHRERIVAEEQRVKAEAERDRFQDTFDLAPLGIGYLTPEGRWLAVNPRFGEMLGYASDALLASPLTELVSQADAAACSTVLSRIVAGERAVTAELRLLRRDGTERWVQLTGSPSRSGLESSYLIAVFEDITARKEAELQRAEAHREAETQRSLLEKAKRELEAAMAVQERFVGIVSHDLRNPLGAALMSAHLLHRLELPANVTNLVARIERACGTMHSLIVDLLDLTSARQGGGIPIRREVVDLAEICRRVVEEVRAAHPNDLIELHAAAVPAEADPERLAQALTNVVANAVKFRRQGSAVRVTLSRQTERASIEIHNEGEPIAADLLPHLFDAFRRGEAGKEQRIQPRGLGLGLYIAQQVIAAHGGSIGVTSVAHSGTRFQIHLPVPTEA